MPTPLELAIEEESEREAGPEQNFAEAFLNSISIGDSWVQLRGSLEGAIDIRMDEENAEKYRSALSKLDEMFSNLKPSEEMQTGVEAVLSNEGFPEKAGDLIYSAYRDRIRSVLLVMQNVAGDHLFDRSGEAEASVYSYEGAPKVLGLVLDISEQYESASGQTPAVGEPLSVGRTLTTPFDRFSAEVLAGLGESKEDADLLEHLRTLRSQYTAVIQETIQKTGLYFANEKPWEARAGNPCLILSPEEVKNRESRAIGKRNEAFYENRYGQDMEVLKRRIKDAGDPTINTWGYTEDGRKQLVEESRLWGKRTKEVSLSLPVHRLEQYVKVPEYKDGQLRTTLKRVWVSAPAVYEVQELGSTGLRHGESAASLRLVAQEVRTTEGLIPNSPVKAQEWLWRLASAEQEVRDGVTYYKVPVAKNGKPCWLPLTEEQYSRWTDAFRSTLRQFERAGLEYTSTKRRQEHDALEVEHGLDDFGIPETSRTWFNVHLQEAAMQEAFDNITVPVERQAEFKAIRGEILAAYALFISKYGQEHEYVARARQIVAESGRMPDDPEYARFYAEALSEVIAEYETMARLISHLSSSEYEVLSFFADSPGTLETEPGWDAFVGMRTRFGEFISRLNGEEPEASSSEQEPGAAEEGAEEETEEPEPPYQKLFATYDEGVVKSLYAEILTLRENNMDWREIRRTLIKKYHPDGHREDPALYNDIFVAIAPLIQAMQSRTNESSSGNSTA